jgi:hypothetical protein
MAMMMFGMAMAAITPMIATTIMSSMSVKPFEIRLFMCWEPAVLSGNWNTKEFTKR